MLVDVGVVNELVVGAGDTVNVTGTETLPPLSTLIVTVVVYVPAVNPVIFTTTATCAVLVMLPVPGDTVSQVALSVAVQVV